MLTLSYRTLKKKGRRYMIKVFGKRYNLSFLMYIITLIMSLVIIGLNILYFIKFNDNLISGNMIVGWVLFIYSLYNLLSK